MALKKEIEISKPFDTIITKYPDGTIAVKKLNFTAFKKVSGYECITDEERLAEKYDRQYKKTETYSDFVAQWADAKRSREIELQGGFLDIASAEKPAFAKSAFESISDDARNQLKKSGEQKYFIISQKLVIRFLISLVVMILTTLLLLRLTPSVVIGIVLVLVAVKCASI